MGRKRINFLVISFVLFFASCNSSANLWYEKSSPGVAQRSQEITKEKMDFVELAKKLNPTVVNVFTTHIDKFRGMPRGAYQDDMFKFFEQFMGRGFDVPRERKTTSLGSGFLINKDGYIVTNNHVVNGADKISVKLADGKEYEAKLIGSDEETDVALIKISAGKDLPFAYLGDSSKTEVGEWVVAIGNPLGHSNTVTAGIVSAKGRLVPEVSFYNDFIQTDAAINPGNSGGPLINVNGEVIGINTAINRQAGWVPIEGIGFAIPINNVKKVIDQLAAGKKVVHKNTWAGIALEDIKESVAKSLGVENLEGGAMVTEVIAKSPAEKAGFKTYDVITAFDGKPVNNASELVFAIKHAEPGKTYVMDVVRNKAKQKISITLGEKQEEVASEGNPRSDKEIAKFGVTVEKNQKGEGVVVTDIDDNSPAAYSGMQQGDVILEVNKTNVNGANSFYSALKKKGSNLFKIKRGEQTLIMAFQFN